MAHVVTMEIRFLAGSLVGTVTETSCSFPCRELADAYAETMRGAIVARPCGGTSPYEVLRAEVGQTGQM